MLRRHVSARAVAIGDDASAAVVCKPERVFDPTPVYRPPRRKPALERTLLRQRGCAARADTRETARRMAMHRVPGLVDEALQVR